jgi:DNA-binding LacI/PurR family transcriptional regulator
LTAVINNGGTRKALNLADLLKRSIVDGDFAPGRFLPSERSLAKQHGLGNRTVRRALKLLESDALVVAEDRRGYRVLARGNEPDKGCPLAFIVSDPSMEDPIRSDFFTLMLAELQRAADASQWSLLGVGRQGRTSGQVVEQLRGARACGAIVDSIEPDLLKAIRDAGIPAVTADAWRDDAGLDGVLQDSFTGGLQAASCLVSRGHRNIGWLGLKLDTDDAGLVVERFSGAVGGLARAGIALPHHLRMEVSEGISEETREAARKMLSGPDRPTAILALWQGTAHAVIQAADDLELTLGKDLEMVGWSTLEQYHTSYVSSFRTQPVQPAVVWSIREMAELCITRLAQRRANPTLPVTKTRITTSLKLPE